VQQRVIDRFREEANGEQALRGGEVDQESATVVLGGKKGKKRGRGLAKNSEPNFNPPLLSSGRQTATS
jgi:hypothetical protein